jgi:hypothetical protein
VPKQLPTGTRYVVEGRTAGNGRFGVSARYLVYPDGQRVDVPGETVLPISCCGSKGATCAKDAKRSDAKHSDAKRSRRTGRRSAVIGLPLGA